VEWVKMEDICDDFKRRNPYPEGAMLPSPAREILTRSKEEVEKEVAERVRAEGVEQGQ
jgi:hypothetical protein